MSFEKGAYKVRLRCVKVRIHVQILGLMAADTKIPALISLLMVVAYKLLIDICSS